MYIPAGSYTFRLGRVYNEIIVHYHHDADNHFIGLNWLWNRYRFLLHWMMPSVDIGIGILIGVIAMSLSIIIINYVFGKIGSSLERHIERVEEMNFEPNIHRPRSKSKKDKYY